MSEQELVIALIIFVVGLFCGVIATLVTNKIRSGSASPTAVKREMEEYQDKVEAHFDETSQKFKQMATQYQDLYKHLSVGATSLCRPENIAPGLVADVDPLSSNLAIDKKPAVKTNDKTDGNKVAAKQEPDTDSKIKADLAKLKAEQAKAKQSTKVEVTDKPTAKADVSKNKESATAKKS